MKEELEDILKDICHLQIYSYFNDILQKELTLEEQSYLKNCYCLNKQKDKENKSNINYELLINKFIDEIIKIYINKLTKSKKKITYENFNHIFLKKAVHNLLKNWLFSNIKN